MKRILALDAMGVIYRVGDDLRDLLIPFVDEHGGTTAGLADVYRAASRGDIPTDDLWRHAGLSPDMEDAYLSRQELADGIRDFLERARTRFETVACLSNDISRWSRKLRRRFGIEPLIAPWVISGDVGFRKPAPEIYAALLAATDSRPDEVLFIDDRIANVRAARALGISAVLYAVAGDDMEFPSIARLEDVLEADWL